MSLWRALQTWTWRADESRRRAGPSVFCRRAIEHLAASLQADDDAWRDWYARHGLEPAITVVYEDLAAEPGRGPARGARRARPGGAALPPRRAAAAPRRPTTSTEEWRQQLRVEV